MMKRYKAQIAGNDTFRRAIEISAQDFPQAYGFAMEALQAIARQTIEQIRVTELYECFGTAAAKVGVVPHTIPVKVVPAVPKLSKLERFVYNNPHATWEEMATQLNRTPGQIERAYDRASKKVKKGASTK